MTGSRRRRAFAGVIALALAAMLVMLTAAVTAAAPGAQTTPTLTPNPVATPNTLFTLSVPDNAFGDGTGAAGWRVNTFVVNQGVNPAALTFGDPLTGWPGGDFDATDGIIKAPLFQGESAAANILPATTPPG